MEHVNSVASWTATESDVRVRL